eukprot:m.1225438 g.1225438  ORF g.1225438 m.1225438 type:complete len:61 (+) comp24632_c1_seq2:207-389(+)
MTDEPKKIVPMYLNGFRWTAVKTTGNALGRSKKTSDALCPPSEICTSKIDYNVSTHSLSN